MNSNEYNDYIDSEEWKSKRQESFNNHGKRCAKCGETMNLQVHHKDYDKEFGEEDTDSLMVVCENCHKELHQDLEFFDNIELKNRCVECNKLLINGECKKCGIKIEVKNDRISLYNFL